MPLVLCDRISFFEDEIKMPASINEKPKCASFVQGPVVQAIGVILTFYILFYFLRDRTEALQLLRSMSPLSKADMNRLFVDVFNTVRATVYGTLAVAAVQGTLGLTST